MAKKRPSAGYLYDVALVLVCLAFLSSYFVSGMLAKFASGDSGSDSARVAQWNVTTNAPSIMLLPNGGSSITYPITVTVNTETASVCDVTVIFDEDMSGIIENPHIGSITPNEGASFTDTLTFSGVQTLAPTEGAAISGTLDLVLQVKAAYLSHAASSIVDDYDNDIINGSTGSIPFTVTVSVEQID